MDKIMNFMTNSFAPKVNKVVKNPWISAIQDSIMVALPLVFVGSLVTVVSLLKNIFSGMPDFSMISNFSFGMYALVVAFLIPYYLMEKKRLWRTEIDFWRSFIGIIHDAFVPHDDSRWRSSVHSFPIRCYWNVSFHDYWLICRVCYEFCSKIFFLR